MRSVPMVACRCASPSVRTRAPGPRSRPCARSVGRPASRSRTCAPSRCMLTRPCSDRPCVSRPTRTMKIGTSGSTTTRIAAETQSSPSTTSRTPGVTVAASTSCGRYRTKYGSSASSPRVASVTTDGPSPEASQRGPSATACATTCSRSSATVRVAARCAKRSCTAVTSARTATTAASHAIVGRRTSSVAPSETAAPSACASSSACATTSAAVTTPSAAVRATYPRAARACRSRRGSSGLTSQGCSGRAACRTSGRCGPGSGPRRSACGTPSTSSPGRAGRAG